MQESCYAVLLRRGSLDLIACFRGELFATARILQAGICGVFDEREQAEVFVEEHQFRPEKSAVVRHSSQQQYSR